MFLKSELYLLKESIDSISESFFFNAAITGYLKRCNELIDKLIADFDTIGSSSVARISSTISQSIKYLSGSTLNKIPYEIVFSLEKALNDWAAESHIICTALLDDRDFHFNGIDLKEEVSAFFDFGNTPNLIYIALPKVYRHKYLYGPALYHELGHYIDKKYKISELTFFVDNFIGSQKEIQKEYLHRKELFADLFSASYVGFSIVKFLNDFAGDNQDSDTHPATSRRVEIINKYLNSEKCKELDRINSVLAGKKHPTLKVNFKIPDLSPNFGEIKTYRINNVDELHGIIPAAWTFLDNITHKPVAAWAHFERYNAEKIVNDLVEKSVRNYALKEKWKHATSY